MHQIREGFTNGLSNDQIRIYADPEFSCEQMIQIRFGFQNRLTKEQVQQYAHEQFQSSKMEVMRKLLESGIRDVNIYEKAIGRYNGLPAEQSAILAKAADSGISLAKLDVIANGHFSTEQIEFLIGNLPKLEAKVSQTKVSSKSKNNKER